MDGDFGLDSEQPRVTLSKGDHRWSFSCDAGEQAQLLCAVQSLAREGDGEFDWLDAAVVSHQLARGLTSGLHKFSNTGPKL